MRRIILFLLAFLSASVSASTCIGNEKQVLELSEKYRDQVEVEVARDDYAVDVTIRFPKVIEGQKYDDAALIRGDVDSLNFDFVMPLLAKESNESDEQMVIWYVVNESLMGNTTIELSYSSSCGPVIRYPVT